MCIRDRLRWIEQLPSKQWARGSSPFGRTKYGGCSSVGRAPDCGSGCRGFESHLPPHLKSGTANSHADLPFCNNGPSPSGKARDFDSRIPLVRIQLAQPAKRPQRTLILCGLLALAAHTPAAPPSCFFIRQGGPAFPRRALARGASL